VSGERVGDIVVGVDVGVNVSPKAVGVLVRGDDVGGKGDNVGV